jgi:cytidine deaminase
MSSNFVSPAAGNNLSEELRAKAIEAMKHSYSPYSQRQVGAAILLSNGNVYSGCNIENSSFGATVCAERTAVWNAVVDQGPGIEIVQVVVATEASPPWSPCGLCRQVINEFVAKECDVFSVNPKGDVRAFTHHTLLPHAFDRSSLIP